MSHSNQNSSDDQISTKNIFRPNFDKKYIPNKFRHNTFGRHFRPQFNWSQLGWLTIVWEDKIAIPVHCPQFEVRVRSISATSLGFPPLLLVAQSHCVVASDVRGGMRRDGEKAVLFFKDFELGIIAFLPSFRSIRNGARHSWCKTFLQGKATSRSYLVLHI